MNDDTEPMNKGGHIFSLFRCAFICSRKFVL